MVTVVLHNSTISSVSDKCQLLEHTIHLISIESYPFAAYPVEFIFNTVEVVLILFQIPFRHLKYFVDNWLSVFVCTSHSGRQLHSVERSCLLYSVNLVCRIHLSLQNTTNKRTWSFWNPHIWLQFCSMSVDPPLTAWPRY